MDLSSVEFIAAAKFTKGRTKPVQLIVLHDMEAPEAKGTARNVAHYFASSAPASAHFCVDNLEIIQCVKLEDTAWQCRNANNNGVGIEHAGYAKQTAEEWADPYSKAMLELSCQLSASLCKKFDIPARPAKFAAPDNPEVIETGFVMHKDVPLHGSHTDPGPNFPFAAYLERVGEILASQEDA